MTNKKDVCQITAIDEKKVRAVRKLMLDDGIFASLSDQILSTFLILRPPGLTK